MTDIADQGHQRRTGPAELRRATAATTGSAALAGPSDGEAEVVVDLTGPHRAADDPSCGRSAPRAPAKGSAADILGEVFARILKGRTLTVPIRFWDGSVMAATAGTVPRATIVVRSPKALQYLLFAPGELGLGRAYVSGELDVEGDVYAALDIRASVAGERDPVNFGFDPTTIAMAWRAARRLGAIGRPPAPPAEESDIGTLASKVRRGAEMLRPHSRERDRAAISHHYDVGNRFYRTVLGSTMTYSCAFFAEDDFTLDEAQHAKYELVCQKLGLRPGMRLLDIGCGWGGMVLHAAKHHGVSAVGISLSTQQVSLARERVAEAGLADRIDVRLQDYRDLSDGPFDAVSSIGMFEHVGAEQQRAYFEKIRELLVTGGRVLNHAISSPDSFGEPVSPRSFIGRYVFPDGQLHEVGSTVTNMQDLHLEVRDVESLREHYGRTLRAWGANLDANWDAMVAEVGPGRARVWRLYMAACALHFEAGRTNIHQVLAVKTDAATGASGMPASRRWLDHRSWGIRVRD
jgi:cyclopropane-fatty-acyl-phospholipid synthase